MFISLEMEKIDTGWEDGLVVEITGYSFRGPRLES